MPDEPDILLPYVDPYYAAAIVGVMSAWARFEQAIDEIIWRLAEVEPNVGVCLTAQFAGIQARFNALFSLGRSRGINAEKIMELNKFQSLSFRLSETRNRIAHDAWYIDYTSKQHYRWQRTAKGRLDFSYKSVPEAELRSTSQEIETMTDEFRSIGSEIIALFLSLPEP